MNTPPATTTPPPPMPDSPPPPPGAAVENPTSDTPVPLSLSSPAPDVSPVENPISDIPVPLSLSSPAPDHVSASHKSRQVSKFKDRYGLVVPYCGEFEFESDPNYDYLEYIRENCDSGDDEEVEEGVEKHYSPDTIPTLIKYINQVRQSFGFDVDCYAPDWFNGPFGPVDLSEAKLDEDQFVHNYITRIVDFAITEINADLRETGKKVELVQLDKFVTAGAWTRLLTLSVKEVDAAAAEVVDDDKKTTKIIQAIVNVDHGPDVPLIFEQWRFKPEGDDVWYKPGDEEDDDDDDDDDDDEEEWR